VVEVNDGLALIHVEQERDGVDQWGFFCFEADNIWDSDLPVWQVDLRGTYRFSVTKPPVQLYFLHTV
jgi:hypothetical protein